MTALTAATTADWMRRFADVVAEQRDHLTELDSPIGDADHGVNMARGTKAAAEGIDDDAGSPGAIAKSAGMTMVSKVGGAAGPLYGTFLMRFAKGADGDELDGEALVAALDEGVQGVMDRGKATTGEATMLDAMVPAVDALREAVADGASLVDATAAAADAADEGRDATEAMEATKGRASYQGRNSIGHIDPGAASTAMLFHTLADAVAAS